MESILVAVISILFFFTFWFGVLIGENKAIKKSRKLCRHEYEYVETVERIENAGATVDVYQVKIFQCKHDDCLKIKEERIW